MLRFIKNLMVVVPRKASFQYISCYGLSQNIRDWCHPVRTFQYISCYGLSTTNKHMFIWWNHFNTSHVTVYPRLLALKRNQNSDFNTSHVTVYLRTRCSPFFAQLNFNTSHVTVYRRYNQRPLVSSGHFNTSHATVYPDVSVIGSVVPTISIHLMLRFICFGLTIANSLSWFQYISCYGLSPDTRRSFWHVDISIHLMLRFITLSGYCK